MRAERCGHKETEASVTMYILKPLVWQASLATSSLRMSLCCSLHGSLRMSLRVPLLGPGGQQEIEDFPIRVAEIKTK